MELVTVVLGGVVEMGKCLTFDLTCALLKLPCPTESISELHAGAVLSGVGRQRGSVMEGSKLFIDRNISLNRSLL